MVKLPPIRGSAYRPAIYAALLATVLSAPALAASSTLPADVLMPPKAIGETRIHVAQNQQSSAQLLVRIQELEDLIRTLTGRVEGLEFQLTQMQTQLAKQAEDNEFRFQELEGGAGGKPQAAAPTDGVTPSDTLPQTPAQEAPATAETAPQQLPTVEPLADGGEDVPMDALGDGAPMDSLGDSADPLLKGGIDQLGTMDGDSLSLDPTKPLDLSLGGGGEISSGDAQAQYDAGADAVSRGDYAFAEDQFQQFVALYPDDPKAPEAVKWLGEALLQRGATDPGAYDEAAKVLFDGYKKYQDTKWAPEILLRLGIAFNGTGEVDGACRTFFELSKRYKNLEPADQQRLQQEAQKAKCPVS